MPLGILVPNLLPIRRPMTPTPAPAPLEEKLTAAARAERLARAEALVKNYTLGSAAIALVPLPLVDHLAVMALEVKLVHHLAGLYDVPFQPNAVRAIVSALLSGLTGGLLTKGLHSLAKAVPVLGTLGGGGGFAVSSATVTYALGSVFIKHFEADGTLLNLDTEWLKSMFHNQLKWQVSPAVEEAPLESTPEAAAAAG